MKSKSFPEKPNPVNPVILSKVFVLPAVKAKDPDRITGLTG
ncbi:MAG: hypothetical protein ACP5SH_05775 [Syntrophobacteraceae bacterium]